MGRSKSNSCFKIIACGGDSGETDDLQAPELQSKSSSDKRWSFRKRSARHRVLSNSVISENQTANKESPESANLGFQPQETSTVQEKISVIEYTDEKPQLPVSTESKSLETVFAAKDEPEVEDHLDESVVIVIQTAVRGFLAKRELLKLKNVIKLQAAVRGHLVRQDAVGTLRCVQAIVKMQALVRARQARLLQNKNLDGVDSKKKENSSIKQNFTYISIEKLLSNSFARQLMESTPRNKPIHIKCSPSNQNSAWNWLERWMAVSSAEPTPKPQPVTEEEEELQKSNIASLPETSVASEIHYELENSVPDTKEIVLMSDSDKNLNNFNVISNKELCSLEEGRLEQSEPESEKIGTSDAKEASVDSNSALGESIKSDEKPPTVGALPHKPEREAEQPDQPKRSMKRIASEELETEGKKFVYGSRKASNPAFIAVQSKFEELSSAPNSSRSFGPFHQDIGVESNTEVVTSGLESIARTKESTVEENSGTHISRGQFGGSECGTELSVTSTLDSPDISEVGLPEYEREAKSGEDDVPNTEEKQGLDAEVNDESKDPVSTLSSPVGDQPEKLDSDKGESANSIVHPDSSQFELQQQRSASDVHRDLDMDVSVPAYRSSPEASPRSHMTVPESHGTPSSQVSVNAKKNRAEKSGSSQKRKSLSSGKRTPSHVHDSGARNSTEQLPKDQKNGKRRNSFGSPKPETPDQEPRDSSSNSSLPHFMQATESARAKLQANNSPRSSPDVHDRDYIKKRHSLPGANGRQGSPRVQRSMSQAQQGAKGSAGPVVHEKKWQR